jgi:hypothetical protein
MIRRTGFIAVLAVAVLLPLAGINPTAAQEATAECASTFWLEPLAATAEADEVAVSTTAYVPAWMTTELTDACSGEVFTLADFAGKTLFVEPMATWCTNCHGQLTRLQEAAAQIPEEDRGDIVLVALSSEVGLPREDLAAYADSNGFSFIFAVMSDEMLRAMVEDLGQDVAVPPATPHLIVGPDGTIGELRTGVSSPEDLLAFFAEAQATEAS